MSQPESSQLHRRLILNTGSNVIRHVVTMAVMLFLTPFIIRTLGDSLYGFWILVMSFIGYASLLEMSVQPAVVKMVAQYGAIDDSEKLEELISAAGSYFLGVGVVAGIFLIAVAPIIVANISDLDGLTHTRYLFLGIALDAVILYMNYLFTGILYGRQKYHLKNIIDISGLLLSAALILRFLPSGGLLAIIAAKLVTDVCVVTASAFAAKRVLPGLHIRPGALRRRSFAELFSFGGRIFISGMTTRVATLAQPLIISTAINAAATAFYAIPVRLCDYTRQLTWTLTTAFMPMFSELESRKERDTIRKIYLSYTRYIFLALLAMAVLLFVYGGPFIGLWIGAEYLERGRIVLYLLVGTLFVESFQPLLWRFFIGVSELNVLVKVSAISSLTVVALGAVLARFFNIAGVAFSVLAGAVIAQSIYALHACRYLEVSPFAMFLQVHARPLLASALFYGFTVLLEARLGSESYLPMIFGSCAGLIVYAGLAWSLALTGGERTRVYKKFARRRPLPGESVP